MPSSIVAAIRQIREKKINSLIFTSEAFIGNAMEELGSNAEGVIVGWLPPAEVQLQKSYQQKYQTDSWDAGIVQIGYKGIEILAHAIVDNQQADVIDALTKYLGASRRLSQQYILYKVQQQSLHAIHR